MVWIDNTMTLKAIIWCAVSSSHQADDDRASLPAQEADALAYAQSQNWRVVDILRVPGHSRDYIDIHEAAAAMRAADIDAFDKLIQHWKAKDFDVLICRDGTRFARTQALHAYVVESTIQIGACIYSLSERLTVDASNARMWTSMGGFASASEVDNLKRRIKIGKDNRALARGLASNGSIPRSHRQVRDPQNGKIIRIELNPDTAQEWQDLAALLLEGVALSKLPAEMLVRFGYGVGNGRAHARNYYYALLYSPAFWGHTARNHPHSKRVSWSYMDDEPAPPSVILKRHTHPPVYTGELAEAVKMELSRRENMHGRARSQHTHRLSGLVNCAVCGYRMVYSNHKTDKRGVRQLMCASKYNLACDIRCDPANRISEPVVVEQFTLYLLAAQRHGRLAFTTGADVDLNRLADELSDLATRIANTENQIRTLISKQATAPLASLHLYDESITAAAAQLEALKARQLTAMATVQAARNPAQDEAIERLQTMTVDDFWQRDERVINQQLHQLLGKMRIFIKDGRITTLRPATRTKGRI